jgi:formylglycine-generating enzyme required for sulfatase activity/cytochrome c2
MKQKWASAAKILAILALGILFGLQSPGSSRALTGPAVVQVFTDCPNCPQMVVVPAGSFQMGSTPEEQHWYGVPQTFAEQESPRHPVTIGKAFAMSRLEITRAQYAAFVADMGHPEDPKGCSAPTPDDDVYVYRKAITWRTLPYPVDDRHPINCVSWLDGQAYVAWLSKKTGHLYRLPTEAEWEYAARGGTTTAAYWGDTSEVMCTSANVMTSASYQALKAPESWRNRLMCSGEHSFTVPVGSYAPNPFGLSDMIGNVWEWVQDCSHNSYVGAPTDGSAWDSPDCAKRTIRGGAFSSAPFFGRAATRESGQIPDHVGIGVGLRVVRNLDGAKLILSAISTQAPVVGDPVAGKRQFIACTKCHTVEAGGADQGVGPALHGVLGKKAGTNRPAYAYSPALKSSSIVWSEAMLDAWIKDPAVLVPNNEMTWSGQPDPQIRANIVAYLKTVLGGDTR